MTIKFALVLLILKQILAAGSTSISVSIADNRINSITNYTWTLTWTDLSGRTFMNFIFPPSVSTSSSTVSYIGGALFIPTTVTSNSITINTSGISITSPLAIVITNITNPYSALTSVTSFTFNSNLESNIVLSLATSKNYVSGTLSSCLWSFNQCTQQSNSQLTINLKTANHIPAGSQMISVGFPTSWTNLNQKSLLYGSSSLVCSISFNGGAIISSGISCSSSSNQIAVSFNLSSPLSGNDSIALYIQGVMSPPTINTPPSTYYTVQTADSSGNKIDGVASGSYCSISPVCVTSLSNGIFSPSTLLVNSVTTSIQTIFNSYPTITFMNLDTVEVYYSQSSNLVSCGIFKVIRSNNSYPLTSNFSGGVMAYYFSTITTSNKDYAYAISVYLECANITAPQSQAPVTFLYKFKRNGDQYLELSGNFSATAATLNSSTASLSLSSYQMGSISTTYQFSFTNGHALSSTPSFVIAFPSDISLVGATCMIGINASPTSINCTSSATNLIINYSGASIAVGSSIVIQVLGITNPLFPYNYNFGLTTYYNSNVSTSRVQYNAAAFTTAFTAITNFSVALTPPTFTVYTLTSINISFISPLIVPSSSTFTLIFPSEVTSLTPSANPLIVNNNYAVLNAAPTINGSTLTFSNSQNITFNSSIVITLYIRSPTYFGLFSSIQLIINQNNLTYIQSLNSMPIQVATLGSIPVAISPTNSITGEPSSYLITLTLTIPHPDVFLVKIDVANDTKFISAGATCASNCSSLNAVGNSVSFTVSNPYANSTSPMSLAFTISSFQNARSVGQGAAWNITTMISAANQISTQSGSPIVAVPNLLTGALQSNVFYYRNNNSTLKMVINLTNLLQSTDYLIFSMDKQTFSVFTNVSCSPIYGTCIQDPATTNNVLVIKVIPNSTNLFTNSLQLWIEGLVSGQNTNYLQTDYITVGSYTINGNVIDQGKVAYNISCRDTLSLPNNCKTCYSSGACIDCYTSQGYFLNGSTNCVTSCGSATSYLYYGNSSSGKCQTCSTLINGCLTCVNDTSCLTCLNSSYYLYTSTMACSLFCTNTTGYFSTFMSGIRVCVPCADTNCLVCTSTSFGSCTQCTTTSILVSGICSNNCPSPSYYVVIGVCVACDPSCYTCSAAGNQSCTICSTGYYNSSGVCLTSCPTGKAVILSTGICGCYSTCLTCASNNYANCTACINTTLFVYNGQCVQSCPNSTYLSASTCLVCPSGCISCLSSICLACATGLYIFSNTCYSDCNLISIQFDALGSTCILCPTGCDTCSNGICSSCLSDYSLSSSSCVKTCLTTNSCQINSSNVLPLPGCLTIIIWGIIVLIIRFFSHQNYVPYSLILFSSLVQFCLILAVISQTNSSVIVSRLLTINLMSKNIIIGLLAFSLVINYATNFVYLYIFMKYIKPLLVKPKQIDLISNGITLAIAVVTNYRFAIVAFSKMFPKPRIHIDLIKNLTPVHYICFASLIFSIFPVIAGGVGLSKQQKLSNLYMLCLDLLIVIIFNDIITIWFISSKKDDKYFDNELKKEYQQEKEVNMTKQNIAAKNTKDESNINMIASIHESQNHSKQSDDYDFGESYKKFKTKKTKIYGKNDNTILIKDRSQINQLPNGATKQQKSKIQQEKNIFEIANNEMIDSPHKKDINFQEAILNRSKVKIAQQFSRATTVNRNAFDQNPQQAFKSISLDENKFDKQFNFKQGQCIKKESKDIEKNSNIDIDLEDMEGFEDSFNNQPKQKKLRPRRTSTNQSINLKKEVVKNMGDNKSSMKKGNKRYLESEANQLQRDEKSLSNDDLASIIKLKIHESSIRKSQNITVLASEENDLQQISPSYYNLQNQRFNIEDIQALSDQS